MPYLYRKQPLRGLYLAYQALSTLLIRVPLWILFGLPKSLRPRKSWDLRRTVMVNLVRHLFAVQAQAGPLVISPNHLAITPGIGVNGVWVSPVPKDLIVGKLDKWAEQADVTSIRVPGYWMHKKGVNIDVTSPPKPGEKVVYALHGGAYTRLSAHPSDPTAAIARGLVKTVDNVHRVFSLEYRLSSAKPFPVANPFPAALLDALAGYLYLVNEIGIPPSDIIVEGDSAGGNLALALTRYLTEYRGTPGLPAPPGALLLLSPWGDIGNSHINLPNAATTTNLTSDYLVHPTNPGYRHPVGAFVGPHGLEAAEINPYISPASLHPAMVVDFKDFPRTFIVAGGAEILLDSIHTLRDRFFKDLGEGNGVKEGEGKTRYYEAADGVHDFLVFPWHEPERTETLQAIAEWATCT